MLRLLLLSIIGSSIIGCGGDRRPQPVQKPTTTAEEASVEVIESPSMQFLPRREEARGWRLQEDPLVYPAARLSEYLAGDAQHFISYSVHDMTVGQYQQIGGNGFATVEIFRFPDFVKAFGAYSARRKAVTSYLQLGNEAFMGPHSIHIWSGPFYVRMIGGGAPQLGNALVQLAAAVAERMPKAPSKPAIFSFLPTDFRVVNSEVFSSDPGFGQQSLAYSFIARYNVDGEEVEGLVYPAESRAAATKVLDNYRGFFVTNGKILDPIPNLGEDNFTGEDRYYGRVVAFRIDRFVVVFRGYDDRQKLVQLAGTASQRILNTIRRQLVTAEKQAERAQSGNENPSGLDWTDRRE